MFINDINIFFNIYINVDIIKISLEVFDNCFIRNMIIILIFNW